MPEEKEETKTDDKAARIEEINKQIAELIKEREELKK